MYLGKEDKYFTKSGQIHSLLCSVEIYERCALVDIGPYATLKKQALVTFPESGEKKKERFELISVTVNKPCDGEKLAIIQATDSIQIQVIGSTSTPTQEVVNVAKQIISSRESGEKKEPSGSGWDYSRGWSDAMKAVRESHALVESCTKKEQEETQEQLWDDAIAVTGVYYPSTFGRFKVIEELSKQFHITRK
jgi:hypothetical protein